ncbi:MAG TPA: hypothetical protein VF039_03355 [Longimicrobiales bacterium]
MIWAILAFGFAALGSKVLLSAWIIWIFLPSDVECGRCDGLTAQVEARRGLRTIHRWCRIQQRWCPACGEHFLARGQRPPRIFVGAPTPPKRPGPDTHLGISTIGTLTDRSDRA